MADTDITLKLGLDTKDANRTAQDLQKEVRKIFKDKTDAPAVKNLQRQMKDLFWQLRETRQEMQEMLDIANDYDSLTNEFSDLTARAQELEQRIEELTNAGGNTEQIAQLQQELSQTQNDLSVVVEEMRELEQTQVPTEEFARLQQRAEELEQALYNMSPDDTGLPALEEELAQVNARMDEMRMNGTAMVSPEATEQFQNLQVHADGLQDKLKVLIARYREMHTAGNGGVGKLVSGFNKLKSAISKVASTLKSKFNSAFNKTNKFFKGGLKNILKYAIGIGSLYALFSKLRSAIKEGFTNLYNSNDTFKKSVDSLKGSLTTLKNSFAAAFQPIVSMAIPYIQKLIDWMTDLMEIVAKFTASITGQKYYTKAIKQTGQAAEKASRQLSGLDKLNVLTSDNGSGSEQMFEEIPIDAEKIDLLEKLREIVGRMEELGGKVGQGLKDALDSIPWDKIREVTNLIAEGIGNFVNGFVRVEGLGTSIGKTIGEVINTIVQFKQTLLDTIDFKDVGRFIGDGLQGIVDTVDWKGIGHLFATEFNSIFEFIDGVTEKFDGLSLGTSLGDLVNEWLGGLNWDEVGKALSQTVEDIVGLFNGFLQTVEWKQVGSTISNLISAAAEFVIDFLAQIDWSGLGEALADIIAGIDWFRLLVQLGELILGLVFGAIEFLFGFVAELSDNLAEFFHDIGWDGVAGLFEGISTNLRESIQWLKDTFNKYIVQPIKDFFGIHSPSTMFADFGVDLIKGLINGISEKIQGVVDKILEIKQKVSDKFTEIKESVIKIMEDLWTGVKKPINAILGGIEKMANGVISGINKMIGALNGLSFDIPDWVPLIGGKTFGLSIPTLSSVSIPRLAQGAVIPPNKEFLAMLGDQKQGTNVEAPLDTIKQALAEVLGEQGNGEQTIVLNLDGREFMKAIVKQNNEYKKQHNGLSALA